MKLLAAVLLLLFGHVASAALSSNPITVFETTSVYHHIRVIDQDGVRTLRFDGAPQTRMALLNPLQGHFEYIDYFHMPLLWNPGMTNILMIGLGGGSSQRLFQRYHTNITVETVEIDPVVVDVARDYFQFAESPSQKVHVADGRVFLRRSNAKYGAIIMDAYVHHRYGSAVPYHLATKEFFALARDHLTTNGVVAYNVISMARNSQADLLGAIYKTLKDVFPQVYMFPAQSSQNIVLIATRSPERVTLTDLQQRAIPLLRSKRAAVPSLWGRLNSFRDAAPLNIARCSVLTDDFAPVDGLLPAER
jgi:spermidine synthase